jgi:hypothetical protein
MKVNCYDFDGVVSIGINPEKDTDVIITGRCIDESEEIYKILRERGINNPVYFNPIFYLDRGDKSEESWKSSGRHKAIIVGLLKSNRIIVDKFFEDNNYQAKIIKEQHPEVNIVLVKSNLVEL